MEDDVDGIPAAAGWDDGNSQGVGGTGELRVDSAANSDGDVAVVLSDCELLYCWCGFFKTSASNGVAVGCSQC